MRNWKKLSKVLPSGLAANGKAHDSHKVSVDDRSGADGNGAGAGEVPLGYKSASFKEMLRYATSFDYFLLTLGVIAATINGIIPPLSTLIFRDLTDTLMSGHAHYIAGNLDVEDFTSRILTHCFHYFLVGSAIFASNFASFTCFFTLCERQVHRIRRKFFFAVLNQVWCVVREVGWIKRVGCRTPSGSTGTKWGL